MAPLPIWKTDTSWISGWDQDQLFAKQDIPAGTRILAEKPLFASDTISAIETVCLYQNLKREEQDLFNSFAHTGDLPPTDEEIQELVQAGGWQKDPYDKPSRLKVYEALIRLTNRELNDNENGYRPIVEMFSVKQGAEHVAIFKRHCFKIRNSKKATEAFGFFPTAARLRHSCIPNCYVSWNAAVDRLCIHVLKDLSAGTELTIAYNAKRLFFQNRQARRRTLREKYNINCTCPACDTSTTLGQRNEVKSKEIETLMGKIAVELNQPGDPNGGLDHMYAKLNKALRDLEINTWERGAMHMKVSQVNEAGGLILRAEEELKEATRIAVTCLGADNPETKYAQAELERVSLLVRERMMASLRSQLPTPNSTYWRVLDPERPVKSGSGRRSGSSAAPYFPSMGPPAGPLRAGRGTGLSSGSGASHSSSGSTAGPDGGAASERSSGTTASLNAGLSAVRVGETASKPGIVTGAGLDAESDVEMS